MMGVLGQQNHRFLSSEAVISKPDMFCRQCEQTQDHFACTTVGVCGKTAETSALQDTLMHVVKAVSLYCVAARESGAAVDSALMHDANKWTLQATFSTLTNVNFSDESIGEFITQGLTLQKKFQELGLNVSEPDVANVDLSSASLTELEEFGHSINIPVRQEESVG
jgi:hydroxylamine reductase